jgi:Uma2 family endonuclease
MTTADLLAMPDDGVERWLIRGELREKYPNPEGPPMTIRNRFHSRVMTRASKLIDNWLDQQPEPRGSVLCGEAGVRLSRDPDSTVGIDVVYVSADVVARQGDDSSLIDGVPILAVEILSPSDTVEEMRDKVAEYLHAGVPLVWVIDPYDRMVRVYRPGTRPQFFDEAQELTGEPQLAGFRLPIALLFK